MYRRKIFDNFRILFFLRPSLASPKRQLWIVIKITFACNLLTTFVKTRRILEIFEEKIQRTKIIVWAYLLSRAVRTHHHVNTLVKKKRELDFRVYL